jgi:hypothetical protein
MAALIWFRSGQAIEVNAAATPATSEPIATFTGRQITKVRKQSVHALVLPLPLAGRLVRPVFYRELQCSPGNTGCKPVVALSGCLTSSIGRFGAKSRRYTLAYMNLSGSTRGKKKCELST